jgi:hypothetical protein
MLVFLVLPLSYFPMASGSAASTTASLAGEPQVKSAYHRGDVIEFDPFVEMEWKRLARQNIREINVDRPSAREIKAKFKERYSEICNCYRITYDAPLDPRLKQGFHYLASGEGVASLTPKKLSGQIVYRPKLPVTSERFQQHLGVVAAISAETPTPSGGGFVFFSPVELTFAVQRLNVTSGGAGPSFYVLRKSDTVYYTYKSVDGNERTLTKPAKEASHPMGIVTAYEIRAKPGYSYAFVQWAADEKCDFGCCRYNYSLLRIRSTLEEAAWTRYECDV